MKKIGLLSDTHGHLDDRMINFLTPVDEIWHAGDLGNLSVFDELNKIHPVKAVYGNIDDHIIRKVVPEVQKISIEAVKVLMVHIGGYPGRYEPKIRPLLKEWQPALFISGHSHILKVMYDKKQECLHINPGASGIQGFHKVRTMVRFTIDGANIKDLEVWEYPRRV